VYRVSLRKFDAIHDVRLRLKESFRDHGLHENQPPIIEPIDIGLREEQFVELAGCGSIAWAPIRGTSVPAGRTYPSGINSGAGARCAFSRSPACGDLLPLLKTDQIEMEIKVGLVVDAWRDMPLGFQSTPTWSYPEIAASFGKGRTYSHPSASRGGSVGKPTRAVSDIRTPMLLVSR